jgi:hypothetical protein
MQILAGPCSPFCIGAFILMANLSALVKNALMKIID